MGQLCPRGHGPRRATTEALLLADSSSLGSSTKEPVQPAKEDPALHAESHPDKFPWFEYWKSVQSDSQHQILAPFSDRGTLLVDGAAYFEPRDIERFPKACFVGVAYQIASLQAIDSVAETFKVVIDLNFRFRIVDEEMHVYEEYMKRGNILMQELTDEQRIKTKPPILEIRNSLLAPEFLRERVAGLARCWCHRGGQWAWFATLYQQIRLVCYEEFEMARFPFTRNCLQIQIQAKQSFHQAVFVPYNCRSIMPHWMAVSGPPNKVIENPVRGNTFKWDRSISNWNVEAHHVAFIPEQMSPPMPSGNKFSTFVITVQCKQNSYFYLWNTVPVVMFLPILTGAAVLESYCNTADRLAIVIMLLLTMATYKTAISSWVPQKDYLTFMDWYIIAGFSLILLIGGIVAVTSIFLKSTTECPDDDKFRVAQGGDASFYLQLESIGVGTLIVLWLLVHVYAGFARKSFYLSWPEIMSEENKNVAKVCEDVTNDLKELGEVQFITDSVPDEPERTKPTPPERNSSAPVRTA